jgi:hypothetical protein
MTTSAGDGETKFSRKLGTLEENLKSRGFAVGFSSSGEAKVLHFIDVLTFDDEFRPMPRPG